MSKIIKIKEETKNMLDKLKVHQRQSYDEVIKLLIGTVYGSVEGYTKA